MSKRRRESRQGTVYWFTGLSGAGKTTLASAFYRTLHERVPNVVYLDGDVLREVFGQDLGYGVEARLASARRNAALCRVLSAQGQHVVCATISLFHSVQADNRARLANYREIHVRAPMSVLRARDTKGLYAGALLGTVRDVVGVDITAQEPVSPDLVVDNDGRQSLTSLNESVWRSLMAQEAAHVRSA